MDIRRLREDLERRSPVAGDGRPTVVIVGAGFGGLNAALELRRAPVNVLLIDRNNYHLFQPLLYQVATAGLSPGEIAYPVRAIFRRQTNLRFLLAEVTGVDPTARQLHTTAGPVDYDYLILSVGSQTNYFGLRSVAENGFDMKQLQDAVRIRNHILSMFELASQAAAIEDRKALRTFVVVGGGPTGVECAGALAELIDLVLHKDFPGLNVHETQILLLEATGQLLGGFPDSLSEAARKTLERRRVQVLTNSVVEGYDGCAVTLKDGSRIPAYTLIWAAGVKAADIVAELGQPLARQGRVRVLPTLQTPERPELFVVGDAAYLEDETGAALPLVAPVAIQQAQTAARNVLNLIGQRPLESFAYKDPGSLATIGRNAAVARIGRLKFSGFPAWVVWLVVHLFWLIGYRNRLVVLLSWAWEYFFFERAIRLILDPTHHAPLPKMPSEPTPEALVPDEIDRAAKAE